MGKREHWGPRVGTQRGVNMGDKGLICREQSPGRDRKETVLVMVIC